MPGKTFNILCFGDSLTSGYYQFGLGANPYARTLERVLKDAIDHPGLDVTANGVPGDVASRELFHNRLLNACK